MPAATQEWIPPTSDTLRSLQGDRQISLPEENPLCVLCGSLLPPSLSQKQRVPSLQAVHTTKPKASKDPLVFNQDLRIGTIFNSHVKASQSSGISGSVNPPNHVKSEILRSRWTKSEPTLKLSIQNSQPLDPKARVRQNPQSPFSWCGRKSSWR